MKKLLCGIAVVIAMLPIRLKACPGCSMLNLHAALPGDNHKLWAWGIVLALLLVPFIFYFAGFRVQKVEKQSLAKTWSYTLVLVIAWFLMLMTGNFSPNFGILLMHWFFLPLVFIHNILIAIAFSFPPAALLLLAAPPVYCYFVSKKLSGYIITRQGDTGDDEAEGNEQQERKV